MSEIHDPEIFQTVLDGLALGVYLADRNGKILFWNQGAEHITGHLRHEIIGHAYTDSILVQCNQQSCPGCGEACPFVAVRREGKVQELRLSLHHKMGHSIPVSFRLIPIRDAHGSIALMAGSFPEPRHAVPETSSQRSPVPAGCSDESGVSSRDFIQFHIRENLAGLAEYHIPFTILCLELEQFDHLRASHGREASQAISRAVAETLQDCLRPNDFVGRWADDQFMAILSNCGGAGAEKAAERIRKTVANASIQWWGDRLTAATLVGFATAQPGDTIQSLVQRAQPALKTLSSLLSAGGGSGGTGSVRS